MALIFDLLTPKVDRFIPLPTTRQFAVNSVHSFSKYLVHNSGNGRPIKRTNGPDRRTDGRTDGRTERWRTVCLPLCLNWRRHKNIPFNPLECKGIYNSTSNNIKLVHWPLMGGLLHLVQRGRDWAGPQPAQAPPRCTKCNSPPINGPCPNHRIAV